MLQNLNKYIGKWFAGVVVTVIALAFMMWGVQYYLQDDARSGKTVAKVGSVEIKEHTLQRITQALEQREQIKQGATPLSARQKKMIQQYALRSLIQQSAMTQAAKQAGFSLGMNQVEQILHADPSLQVNGHFSPQRLQQLVASSGLPYGEFLAEVQASLISQQITMGLQNSAIVLPNEQSQAEKLFYQKRDFGYMILPVSNYTSKTSITQKEIQAYYDEHKDEYRTPEQVSIRYIQLTPKSVAKEVKVTEQDLREYYDGNLASVTIPKRWKISKIEVADEKKMQKVQEALKSGQSFSALVKQNAPSSVESQWLTSAQLSPQLVTFLSQLSVNQVSQVFRTSKGFAVIKLLSVQAPKTKSFAEVKERLRGVLVQQKTDALLSKKNEQLSSLSYTNPTSLESSAKALHVNIQQTALFTKDGLKQGLLSNPHVIAAAFSEDVLKQGNNSNPITLKDGSMVVLRVDKHIEAKALPLASVQSKIKNTLAIEGSKRAAGVDAYKIQQALVAGKSAAELAKQYRAVWYLKTGITRNMRGIDSQVQQLAFNTPAKTADTTLLKNGDYAIVFVSAVREANVSGMSAKNKGQLHDELEKLWAELTTRFYQDSVMKAVKIKNMLN